MGLYKTRFLDGDNNCKMSVKSISQEIPQSLFYAFVLSGAMALFVAWDQVHWWQTRDDYSFGFLVPMFVAYVIYDRWESIMALIKGRGKPGRTGQAGSTASDEERSPAPAPHPALDTLLTAGAYAMLVFGLLAFFLGAFYRAGGGASNPSSLLIAVGFGCVILPMIFLSVPRGIPNPGASQAPGWQKPILADTRFVVAALFLFPAFIWIISAPLLSVVENTISLFLLSLVTQVVFFVFDMGGFPLEQQGNTLILPTGRVGVEDACSGIRSLTACLFAGSFLAAVFLNKMWKKVLLVGLAMLFAFFTNILRSLFLTGWAYAHGPEAIDGLVHDATGYAVLGLTCVGLIVLLPIFNFNPEWFRGVYAEIEKDELNRRPESDDDAKKESREMETSSSAR